MNNYINITRLEYVVTYQCSSSCIHCFIPEDQPRSPKHIDPDLAVQILREVGQKYALNSVMTFGGEPPLYPDLVCAIHMPCHPRLYRVKYPPFPRGCYRVLVS